MLSEFKKYTPYFLLFFVVSAALSALFRDSQAAFGICLGFALLSGASLFYILLEMLVLLIKKSKEDKNLWFTENLIADNNAIFVFGEDTRPEADEIVEFIKLLWDRGVQDLDLTLFDKKAPCAFWGNAFLVPFKTTVSSTLCISDGKFYRLSDTDREVMGEFTEISFMFLSELHRELKQFVDNLPDL